MSEVFDFSASLNDVAPVPPILFPVGVNRKEKSDLPIDVFCMSSFFLSLLLRLRAVSVVFDFNDSLNDVAPVSPILFSVDVKINEKSESLMCLFVCILSSVFTTQIEFSECSV